MRFTHLHPEFKSQWANSRVLYCSYNPWRWLLNVALRKNRLGICDYRFVCGHSMNVYTILFLVLFLGSFSLLCSSFFFSTFFFFCRLLNRSFGSRRSSLMWCCLFCWYAGSRYRDRLKELHITLNPIGIDSTMPL